MKKSNSHFNFSYRSHQMTFSASSSSWLNRILNLKTFTNRSEFFIFGGFIRKTARFLPNLESSHVRANFVDLFGSVEKGVKLIGKDKKIDGTGAELIDWYWYQNAHSSGKFALRWLFSLAYNSTASVNCHHSIHPLHRKLNSFGNFFFQRHALLWESHYGSEFQTLIIKDVLGYYQFDSNFSALGYLTSVLNNPRVSSTLITKGALSCEKFCGPSVPAFMADSWDFIRKGTLVGKNAFSSSAALFSDSFTRLPNYLQKLMVTSSVTALPVFLRVTTCWSYNPYYFFTSSVKNKKNSFDFIRGVCGDDFFFQCWNSDYFILPLRFFKFFNTLIVGSAYSIICTNFIYFYKHDFYYNVMALRFTKFLRCTRICLTVVFTGFLVARVLLSCDLFIFFCNWLLASLFLHSSNNLLRAKFFCPSVFISPVYSVNLLRIKLFVRRCLRDGWYDEFNVVFRIFLPAARGVFILPLNTSKLRIWLWRNQVSVVTALCWSVFFVRQFFFIGLYDRVGSNRIRIVSLINFFGTSPSYVYFFLRNFKPNPHSLTTYNSRFFSLDGLHFYFVEFCLFWYLASRLFPLVDNVFQFHRTFLNYGQDWSNNDNFTLRLVEPVSKLSYGQLSNNNAILTSWMPLLFQTSFFFYFKSWKYSLVSEIKLSSSTSVLMNFVFFKILRYSSSSFGLIEYNKMLTGKKNSINVVEQLDKLSPFLTKFSVWRITGSFRPFITSLTFFDLFFDRRILARNFSSVMVTNIHDPRFLSLLYGGLTDVHLNFFCFSNFFFYKHFSNVMGQMRRFVNFTAYHKKAIVSRIFDDEFFDKMLTLFVLDDLVELSLAGELKFVGSNLLQYRSYDRLYPVFVDLSHCWFLLNKFDSEVNLGDVMLGLPSHEAVTGYFSAEYRVFTCESMITFSYLV